MDFYTLDLISVLMGIWPRLASRMDMATNTITYTRPRCTHMGFKVKNGIGPAVCVCMRVTINAMPLSATVRQILEP